MALTPKQEAFCQAVVAGKGISDAYRAVYDCANSSPATINRCAKALIDDHKIAARVAELRAPVVAAVRLTLEQHLRDLEALRNDAKDAGKYSAAISAEVSRGKASGLYVEKAEITGKDGKPLVEAITINLVVPNAH